MARLRAIAAAGPPDAPIDARPWVPCRRCTGGAQLFLIGAPLARRLMRVPDDPGADSALFGSLDQCFSEFCRGSAMWNSLSKYRSDGGFDSPRLVDPSL